MFATFASVARVLVLVGALGSLAVAAVPVARHLRGQVEETSDQPAVVTAPAVEPVPPDLGPILDLAPFGTVEVTPPPETPMGETTLDFVLQGVVVQDDPDASTAFIFLDGITRGYRPGDTVTEGARLVEVASDRVVLDVNGASQTLSFPDPGEGAEGDGYANADVAPDVDAEPAVALDPEAEADGAPDPETEAPVTEAPVLSGPERLRQLVASQTGEDEDAETSEESEAEPESLETPDDDGPQTIQTQIDLWRERISANPRDALESMGLIPADDGYRIAEQHDSGVDQAGLQAGDVITSVNGQAVGDMDRDRQLFDEVVASGQARIEVQRDGRTLVLTFPLP